MEELRGRGRWREWAKEGVWNANTLWVTTLNSTHTAQRSERQQAEVWGYLGLAKLAYPPEARGRTENSGCSETRSLTFCGFAPPTRAISVARHALDYVLCVCE